MGGRAACDERRGRIRVPRSDADAAARYATPGPRPPIRRPARSAPVSPPMRIAMPRSPSASVSRGAPTRSWVWTCCVTCCSARAQPMRTVRARTSTIVTRPSTARVPSAVRASAMVVLAPRSRTRRSPRSARTPAGRPTTSRGAMRRASATPTQRGEFVRSRTSHPRTTCSPAKATVLSMAEQANRGKPGRRRSAVSARAIGGPTVARRARGGLPARRRSRAAGADGASQVAGRVSRRRERSIRRSSGRPACPGRRAPRRTADRRSCSLRTTRGRARRCRTGRG